MTLVYHVLTGPTAAGKTGLLLSAAVKLPLLVISADSRQVYRYMDIGTGKPTPSEFQMLPHHGVDCLEPGIIYSVYQFLTNAARGLAVAGETGRQAWVCGGTGLYIRALTERLVLGGQPRPALRSALDAAIAATSARTVAAALALILADPDNPARVVRQAEHACGNPARAVEIYRWAGLPESLAAAETGAKETRFPPGLEELDRWNCGGIYVLDPGRAALSERICRRVAGMFQAGLVDEVAMLRKLGFGAVDVVRQGIGYREAGQVLDGELPVADALERTIVRTRQYAKRQRTYFKGRGWLAAEPAELARVLQSGPE